ncbi:MAG: toll/interleukin-1 receptor domain-containing protein, partial [Rhodanobacteraceae bacterium]
MADVFVSYARADKARVAPLVAAIEAKGWSVWWDPEITPGQEFDDQIDAEIDAACAVLVVWTPTSVASRWVRGEAREAAERGVLVPVRFEQARLPMDVRAIHTT